MQLTKIVFLNLWVVFIAMNNASADTLVYQCKMKNGKINFTDQPCKKGEIEKNHKIVKGLAKIHSITPKYTPDAPTSKHYRYEEKRDFDEIEREKETERQNEWDNAGYIIGVTPRYHPHPRPNVHTPPPLFKPPIQFAPPLQ